MLLVRLGLCAFSLLAAVVTGRAMASVPYTPPAPETVLLQREPRAAQGPRLARGAPVQGSTADRVAAVQMAIHLGHRTGDPRYFGQAQALLGTDWSALSLPPATRLLRAILFQQRHQFGVALADLDAVIAAEPFNAQAHLVRANIRMVQGEPEHARRDCAALLGQADLLVTATCIGAVAGLNGQAASALQAIEMAQARAPEAPPSLRLWSLTQAAEIAERLGDVPRATRHYNAALSEAAAAGENDVYLKAAHADFLLEQRRAAEVKATLDASQDFDPLLLRLALAEKQLADAGDANAHRAVAMHLKELLTRFALTAARGDPPHRREQAMTALYLQKDVTAALQLAQQNWAEQREPVDARLLLQAALAATTKAAAQPVLEWMRRTKIEDVRLERLTAQLMAAP